jgi:hypothetical protein
LISLSELEKSPLFLKINANTQNTKEIGLFQYNLSIYQSQIEKFESELNEYKFKNKDQSQNIQTLNSENNYLK